MVFVAAALMVSMLQGGIPVARAGGGETFYLALGTSLAVGFQPNRGETSKGYVDVLWRRMAQQIPGLSLKNVGCPGETSSSMITGTHQHCRYPQGSQLDAAVAFLQAHPGQVAFITLRSARTTSSEHASGTPAGSTGRARPTCSPGCRPG